MSSAHFQSLIHRIFYEAFNQGNLTVVDELLTSDHLAHNTFAGGPNGPPGLKGLIAMFRTAFPDLHCTVEDEIRAGDKFAAHWTMRGTPSAILRRAMPSPPPGMSTTSGKPVAWAISSFIPFGASG